MTKYKGPKYNLGGDESRRGSQESGPEEESRRGDPENNSVEKSKRVILRNQDEESRRGIQGWKPAEFL